MYDSMLLSNGGGIIGTRQKSKQFNEEASLIIGIGGTGVAALTRLKQKVYQQLLPDDPDSSVPEYKHIRFLAIDSDTTVSRGAGQGRLTEDEFFSIHDSSLASKFNTDNGKRNIRENPIMDWLDIDRISKVVNPNGAGGIRQTGRYLLINKADTLKGRITDECIAALEAIEKPNINIYICAGISGGTGSGCFLDTCYIVNKVIEENGWTGNAKVMGFFFLPDVVISKLSHDEHAAVSYNRSNGYAAMKELDYLMDLKNAHDRFKQNYGRFEVNTDKPPVDLCHLISATQADGTIIQNGFSYCINVVSDYIINYLADIDHTAMSQKADDDGGLTMRGHISNVSHGVDTIQISYGANRAYHILGASNGEIPMTQIATYLAAGFYDRFESRVGRKVSEGKIHKQVVDLWVREAELSSDAVLARVKSGCGPLTLPVIDRRILHNYGPMPLGQVPMPWATYGNNYLDQCSGKRKTNTTALSNELETFDRRKLIETNAASLIAKVYCKLYDLCTDPAYGPFYAAALLHSGGYDLRAAVRGAIETLESQYQTQQLQLHGHDGRNDGLEHRVVQVSTDFYNKNNRKNYEAYVDVVTAYFNTCRQSRDLQDTETVFRKLLDSLDKLYKSFFEPLCIMLDNLRETFRQNKEFLSDSDSKETSTYTWQILKLSDVQKSLDEAVDKLQDQGNITDFMDYVLRNFNEWNNFDEGKISLFISRYMENIFQNEMNKSLQDYLYQKYPKAKDESELSQIIKNEIISKVYNKANAMFWCDENFDIASKTFTSASITVPLQASAVCSAADTYSINNRQCTIRKTSIKDRVFALRFFSGIPFYAYQGVTLLKKEYDTAEGTAAGVGSHLYEKTGRGEGGQKNWRHFLPSPAPFSMHPSLVDNADELIELYERGNQLGIISSIGARADLDKTKPLDTETDSDTTRPTVNLDYVVNRTKAVPDVVTDISRYMRDIQGQLTLDEKQIQKDIETLRSRRDDPFAKEYIVERLSLLNNGDSNLGQAVVDRVRLDYFLHYPVLQETVRSEIAKIEKLDWQIRALEEIQKGHNLQKQEMEQFANLLFFGILICEDSFKHINHTNINQIYYGYTDRQGVSRTYVFSGPNMEYGAIYPLYQAFLKYRELNQEMTPRREMDKLLETRKVVLQEGDNLIGFELEQAWSGERLVDLEIALSTDVNGDKIIQFYRNLVEEIVKFRNRFPTYQDWIKGTVLDPTAQQAKAVTPKTWTVWTGTEYVAIYDYAPNLGYTSANQWIPLQNGWLISWNGQWIPLKLDATGTPINLPR